MFLTVVAILGTLVGAWCYLTLDESHYWVEYVVPNGYHGIITFELILIMEWCPQLKAATLTSIEYRTAAL